MLLAEVWGGGNRASAYFVLQKFLSATQSPLLSQLKQSQGGLVASNNNLFRAFLKNRNRKWYQKKKQHKQKTNNATAAKLAIKHLSIAIKTSPITPIPINTSPHSSKKTVASEASRNCTQTTQSGEAIHFSEQSIFCSLAVPSYTKKE